MKYDFSKIQATSSKVTLVDLVHTFVVTKLRNEQWVEVADMTRHTVKQRLIIEAIKYLVDEEVFAKHGISISIRDDGKAFYKLTITK